MFTRVENGAEVELTIVDKPVNGARELADGAFRVENGAEIEIWSNTKLLDLILNTTTTGSAESPGEWGNKTVFTALNDNGAITYATEGTWDNPTITLDYHGFCYFFTNDGELRTTNAGTLYAYGVKADGTEEVVNAVTVNTFDEGGALSYSYTFTGGAYTKIGFRIVWANWNISNDPSYSIEISNILIDNQKYITDPADDYDRGDT